MLKHLLLSLLTVFIFVLSPLLIFGQDKSELEKSVFKNSTVIFNPVTKSPSSIKQNKENYISLNSFIKEYKKTFRLSDENEILSSKVTSDKLGQKHHKFKQYYKGIELAEVQFILHEKDGKVFHANGNLIHGLNLDTNPLLSEKEALNYALSSVNAESYMWQNKKNELYIKKEQENPNATMRPKGILMISAKNFSIKPENFRLVYRFDVYSEKPMDRFLIDVDANTGEIINKISRMQSGDIPGQGTSIYNGTVSLTIADTAINSLEVSRWHLSTANAYQGESWWVADPSFGTEGGYDNGWYEGLDTDPISLSGSDITLTFYHRYKVENPGGEPAGYNGWDGMNVRISTDNGVTWSVLQNPSPAYTRTSLYSFGEQHGEGTGVPGWTGELTSWTNVSFNLSSYAGQTVKIRFAFASDPGFSTADGGDPTLFGWQVDNISVSNPSGTLYYNDGAVSGVTAANLVKETTIIDGNFRLRQYGRGGGIATYDARNGISYPLSQDFVDEDENFDLTNSRAGVSVHWALEHTYDYYLDILGRNSFDDNGSKIIAYAHYDNEWFNAQWDGARMRFGDGTLNNIPLVSIDIVSHEFTHGVTQYTAGLIYQDEPGALNESFSDIFGIAVEFRAIASDATWFVGEGGARLRSMSNPNQYGQPDTYLGQNWYAGTADNGGVHTNSGVQNFWYYLLSEGGSGTNDNGYNYSVTSIGMDQASQIAYRNLSTYLIPTSNYEDARYGSIVSAIDLFGENSQQVNSVIEAWNAVGVLKPSLEPFLMVDSDSLNFLAEASATTDTVEFLISNFGLSELIISNIEKTGAEFQIVNLPVLPDTLGYDESFTIKILYTPNEEGEQSGSLTITSNDSGDPLKTISLIGKAYILHPALDKVMYASSGPQNEGKILFINKATGEGNNIGASSFNDILDLSINPVNNLVYAVRSNSLVSEIHRVDVVSGNSYLLHTLDLPDMAAIAFDNSGAFYGTLETGEIYSIDPVSGAYNLISTSDINLLAMTFHPVTNELWGTVRQTFGAPRDKIYKIDITTGDTTFVGQTGFNATTNDIVFDENGVLYGIKGTGTQISDLFTIDLSTGAGTIVGSTGLKAITGLAYAETGVTGVENDKKPEALPKEFALMQNYPNPFNPSTRISFSIPKTELVSLKIYNILGEEVTTIINKEMDPGNYNINFDASLLTSGIYLYQLKAGSFVETKKMILVR